MGRVGRTWFVEWMPAGHRDEVRDEVDGDGAGVRARVQALAGGRGRELLLDLGDVAVAAEAVRLHALVDLAEHHLGLRVAAGAGDAALRVDHEVADEPGTGERGERQQRRRRVAARRADERDRRIDERLELGAMQLGQAVDGDVEELGDRVLEAVPARVVGRVAKPEVGPEVDDGGAAGRPGRARASRRRRGGGPGTRRRRRGARSPRSGRSSARWAWWSPIGLVLAVAAGQPDDLHVRMARQQADELAAGVPGRADDADADPARPAVVRYAACRAGEDPRRPVRRDRRGRPESRAHGRTRPFAEG